MINYQVNVVSAGFPNLAMAVAKIAERGHQIWTAYASGAPLPDGRSIRAVSGAYMRSIKIEQLGPLSWRIFSELPYAKYIEEGTPAYDMKKMLDTSEKVRVSKAGKRYLVIPFRHGTPGASGFASVMTPEIHELARGLSPSRVTGRRREESQVGTHSVQSHKPLMVTRQTYSWGDRLSEDDLRGAGATRRQARLMAGMVKMQNPGAVGGSKHTSYMTFRVMSEDSPGWIRRAMPGYYPAKATAERLNAVIGQITGIATATDVAGAT